MLRIAPAGPYLGGAPETDSASAPNILVERFRKLTAAPPHGFRLHGRITT